MKENTKNILLGVLIVGLVAMTVAYAALTTNLQINGTATVAATTWNVRIEDWAPAASGNTATNITNGTQADNTNTTKITGFSAILNKPGDTVTYNFKIANRGTIAATKTGFTTSVKVQTKTGEDTYDAGTTVANENNAYGTFTNGDVEYIINCTNDASLAANTASDTCSLTVTYKELPTSSSTTTGQKSQTAGEDQTVNNPERKVTIDAAWVYGQAD